MKKNWFVTAIVFFAMAFTVYAQSQPTVSAPKIAKFEVDENSTPDKAVVILFVGELCFDLVQINPDYPQNTISVDLRTCITSPMIPGSTYIISYNYPKSRFAASLYAPIYGAPALLGITNSGISGRVSIDGTLPLAFLNSDETPNINWGRKITVPKEPGFYIDFLDIIKLNRKQYIKEAEEIKKARVDGEISPLLKKKAVKQLKKAVQAYAGTPWESIINEKIQELSK